MTNKKLKREVPIGPAASCPQWAVMLSSPRMSSRPDTAPQATAFTPRDPETFFRAQQRNRRATWRMSGLSVLAALIMGLPLTLVLSPLLYAVTLITADIINYFSPLPQEFWRNADLLGRILLQVSNAVSNHRPIDPVLVAFVLVLALAPGMILTLVLWLGIRALFRRGGVGGMLATMNAREPDRNDFKELQLVDVVDEMAIAAGLPSPKVMLIDSTGANAAAIGTTAQDARLVLSRRLLDDLSRDQLQGLLASLIGSISNGDLRIAFTVTSVFETGGLLVTLINAPFGSQSRAVLWRLIRYAFRRSKDPQLQSEADAVASLLAHSLNSSSQDDIDRFFDQSPNKPLWRKVVTAVLFPMIFTNAAVKITLWFFTYGLLGPCMAMLWRARRYLADATAIQLTRNPDGLAAALQQLNSDDTGIPGGFWASHLFALNPGRDSSASSGSRPSAEQMSKAAQAWHDSSGSSVPAPATGNPETDLRALRAEVLKTGLAAFAGDSQAMMRLQAFQKSMVQHGGVPADMPDVADILAARHGSRAAMARLQAHRQGKPPESASMQESTFVSFHPPLKRRLKRLARMGAHVQLGQPKKSVFAAIGMTALYVFLAVLMTIAAAAMLAGIALMILLNLFFLGLWLMAIHAIFGFLGHR